MKTFFKEFSEFISRGNVMDLAVGVIIGGAFQAIINSLVNDIISPIIGIFASKDFSGLAANVAGVSIKYGSFITSIINFLIMALVIFCIIKSLNKVAQIKDKSLNKEEEVAVPTTKKCPYCLSEIPVEATKCAHCTSVVE